MTTRYTLTERNDQLLLEKISWRPPAIIDPAKEEKRKADLLALKLSCVDVWPGGQMKYAWAAIRFDTEQPTPAEERSTFAASGSER